jgi:hypothetical protein
LYFFVVWGISMKKQYLHLSAYPCDTCAAPVIAGTLAIRENEISKETDIRPVGAICLSCGHRPSTATAPARVRHLLPIEWAPADGVETSQLATAFVDALNRPELH